MALKKLNIKYEIQDKKYPKHWYDDKIRFYIETEKNKSYLLKEIAKTIKTI
jgi:signal recognition particle subunit SEC65